MPDHTLWGDYAAVQQACKERTDEADSHDVLPGFG